MKRLGVVVLGITIAAYLVGSPAIAQQSQNPSQEIAKASTPDGKESHVLIGKWGRFLRASTSPPQTLAISEIKKGSPVGVFETRRGNVALSPENSRVFSENGKIKVELRFEGMANYDLYYEGGELSGKERVLFGQLMNREFDVVFQLLKN